MCVCVCVRTVLSKNECVAPKWSRVDARGRKRPKVLLLLSLLGKEHCLNVGEDATLGNGDA